MATKKAKKTAQVELDAKSVHRFESAIRDGLVASGSVMMADNKTPKLKGRAKVKLDPATAARLSEVLRHGLVASQSVMMSDNQKLDAMTAKVKSSKPRPKSKKR